MGETKIEWATHTANWLAGCTKVSPACTNCYAETMSARLATMPHAPERYHDGVVNDARRWTGRVSYDRHALGDAFLSLLDARRPRRVFCNSMSDTFHADAPPESLADLAQRIRATERSGSARRRGHVIMLLTKRPDRMLAWQREHFPDGLPSWVWCGTTVEDQRRADERVPVLLQVRAAVRFLSVEPMVGPVSLRWLAAWVRDDGSPTALRCDAAGAERTGSTDHLDGARRLSWVIVGGESGPHARPMHPAWVRGLRDECTAAGVPFFFKQWGEYAPAVRHGTSDGWVAYTDGKPEPWDFGSLQDRPHVFMPRVGKRLAGRLLDGRTWDEVPRG